MAKTEPVTAAGFAEQLQTLLGNAQQQAKDWLSQREVVAKTLTTIRDTADKLLEDLIGKGGAGAPTAKRRGRPPGVAAKRGPGRPPGKAKRSKKGGRRKGFKMSAEAKAKIAAAQKARWAKQKKSEK